MRALCVGSAMLDTVVVVDDDDIERVTMHNATASFLLMEQGRKIDAQSITHHVGGGGVNAAVAAARLGVETAALVKIGNDVNGEKVLSTMQEEGIHQNAVGRSNSAPTGSAVMISSHDRNATIFIDRGANRLMESADLDRADVAGFDLVYVSTLSDQSSEQYPPLVSRASAAGAFIAANPGIRQLTKRGSTLMPILDKIDVLGLNTVEALTLTRNLPASSLKSAALEAEKISLDIPEDGPPLLVHGFTSDLGTVPFLDYVMAIRSHGARGVLVTDGANGAYLAFKETLYYCPTLKADVKGTAGAGDSFTATLATLLASGEDPAYALQAAAVNASSVVSFVDTQTGLLDRQTIDARIAEYKDALSVFSRKLES